MDPIDSYAECALVAEPRMHFSSIRSRNLFVMEPHRITQTSPYLLYLMAQRQAFLGLGMPDSEIRKIDQEMGMEVERAKREGEGRAVDLVSSARVRLSLLVDTAGGPTFYQGNLDTIQRYLNRSGGFFSAYGGVDVLSLGAHLLMMAPKGQRKAHPYSKIMFHLGEPDPRFGVSPHERKLRRKEGKRELEELLMEETVPEKRQAMAEYLASNLLAKRRRTPDRQVGFLGVQAAEFGLVESLGVQAMAQNFLQGHGIPLEVIRQTPIDHFFGRLQQLELQTRQKLLLAMGLLDPKEDGENE